MGLKETKQSLALVVKKVVHDELPKGLPPVGYQKNTEDKTSDVNLSQTRRSSDADLASFLIREDRPTRTSRPFSDAEVAGCGP